MSTSSDQYACCLEQLLRCPIIVLEAGKEPSKLELKSMWGAKAVGGPRGGVTDLSWELERLGEQPALRRTNGVCLFALGHRALRRIRKEDPRNMLRNTCSSQNI